MRENMADYNYRATKKPRKIRYHFSLVFFVGVLIFGLMFWRYMKTTTLEDVLTQDRNIIVPAAGTLDGNGQNLGDNSDDSSPTAAVIQNPVPESESKDNSYFDSCTFIGDFLPHGLSSYGIVPQDNVYAAVTMTPANAQTEQVDTPSGKMTVEAALAQSKGENIYIMLSASSSAYMNVGDMYSGITSFCSMVRLNCPESRIFLLSAPPVSSVRESSMESPIKNADIDSYNSKLLEYANTNGIHYLDINTYFKGENGFLSFEDAENDGLHLREAAYEKLANYILSHTAG